MEENIKTYILGLHLKTWRVRRNVIQEWFPIASHFSPTALHSFKDAREKTTLKFRSIGAIVSSINTHVAKYFKEFTPDYHFSLLGRNVKLKESRQDCLSFMTGFGRSTGWYVNVFSYFCHWLCLYYAFAFSFEKKTFLLRTVKINAKFFSKHYENSDNLTNKIWIHM